MTRILLTKVTILAIAFPMVVLSHANADPPFGAAWGLNQDGRLGDGTTMERHTPAQVQNLSGVKVFAAGAGHSLALKDDGTVWAWGLNSHGQLGDGTVAERHTPVQVGTPPLHNVAAIAGGENWSLALKSDGTLWAWGENAIGQLGDGTTIERLTPVQVGMPPLSHVTAIAAGQGHNLALKDDGTVWAWGLNLVGQLGDGTTIERLTPVQVGVPPLSGVTAVAGGNNHSLALKSDGTVWTWGWNINGQLGDGTTTDRNTPAVVPIQSVSGVKALAAGQNYSVALKDDGTVWTWGQNLVGQLGDGTTIERHTPVQVGMPHLSDVIAIAAHSGGGHNLALRSSGIVQAWGWNINGQLGDGTTTDRPFPVQVENLNGTTAIAAGTRHSVAIGTLVAPLTQLTVLKILEHPDVHHLRLFNLLIDGSVVATNLNSGSTGPQTVTPGNHTVSETGGTNTHLVQFGTVIGGDCAANGTVSVALGENKTCVITNFDHFGGCSFNTNCCEEGDGTQQCRKCLPTCP
jgi:alpha-tubulin suppressor-like RCC1 family protein